jgi:hypothetical protein
MTSVQAQPLPAAAKWPFPPENQQEDEPKLVNQPKYPKFLHVRYSYEDGKDNILVADQGGLTIAYEVKDGVLRLAKARCSVKDMFNYKVGRKIASDRLNTKRAAAIAKLATLDILSCIDLRAGDGDGGARAQESIQGIIVRHLIDRSPEADIISVKRGKRHFWLYV